MPSPKRSKRLPLPKKLSVGLTETAYERLRALNATHGLGNNYLLTVLLENLDEIAAPGALATVFDRFIAEYGAPTPAPRPAAPGSTDLPERADS